VDSNESPTPDRVVYEVTVSTRTLVRIVLVVLGTLTALWAIDAARGLVSMLMISIFFALALLPGVNYLHERFGWRRGAAVGAIYGAGFVAVTLMILVLIPAIVNFSHRIGDSGAQWLTDFDAWTQDTFGTSLFTSDQASEAASTVDIHLADWADEIFGGIVKIATSGIGMLFSLATIAMFTFYFAADFQRVERSFLSWFGPRTQERLGWTIDEAIRQTGGYFYSRLLLMVINALGFFGTMVAVGVPVFAALALAVVGAFISVFIPAIGTYIGGAIPIAFTLAISGLIGAIVVLGYVLVYQQLENYWLSPKLSSKTMTLNGGVAFGAALAGGSLFGPMGAFVALPVAALITSFIKNYRRSYEVVYRSKYSDDDVAPDDG